MLSGGLVNLQTYEPNLEGFIGSWVDRFPNTLLDDVLESLAEKDKKQFINMI